MSLKDYYANCALPKGVTRQAIKEQNDDRAKVEHRRIVDKILVDWKFRCAAYGVSPVCTKRAVDPHELVRRGQGGEVSPQNSVPVCRACHHEADGKIGGNRLVFHWKGEDDGLAPRADVASNVWAVWIGRKKKK